MLSSVGLPSSLSLVAMMTLLSLVVDTKKIDLVRSI